MFATLFPLAIRILVVVQFYPWFNNFSLFSFMLIYYDNKYETEENKNGTKDKIELQHTQSDFATSRKGPKIKELAHSVLGNCRD